MWLPNAFHTIHKYVVYKFELETAGSICKKNNDGTHRDSSPFKSILTTNRNTYPIAEGGSDWWLCFIL